MCVCLRFYDFLLLAEYTVSADRDQIKTFENIMPLLCKLDDDSQTICGKKNIVLFILFFYLFIFIFVIVLFIFGWSDLR